MSRSARVESVEALKQLKAHLCEFGVDAEKALCATEIEIRRALDWVQNQMKFWQRQVRERQEEVARTKNELMQRKHWQKDGRGPGYTEQEAAFRKAQERLKEAETKVENCRRWGRNLPQAVNEYEGPARQLAGLLEADLRNSIALLERKITALDAYVAMAPPSLSNPAVGAAPAEISAPNDAGVANAPVVPSEGP